MYKLFDTDWFCPKCGKKTIAETDSCGGYGEPDEFICTSCKYRFEMNQPKQMLDSEFTRYAENLATKSPKL